MCGFIILASELSPLDFMVLMSPLLLFDLVYIALSLLCVLTMLPLAPFAHKMHSAFTILVFVLFLGSTLYAWLMFPFDTRDARCRVYFSSRTELANFTASSYTTPSSPGIPDSQIFSSLDAVASNHPKTLRTITQLTGAPGYIDRIVAELPSSWSNTHGESKVSCMDLSIGGRLRTCEWEVEEDWKPAPVFNSTQAQLGLLAQLGADGRLDQETVVKENAETEEKEVRWMAVNATRLDDNLARFVIQPTNSRNCRVYVDGPGNVTVTRYRVLNTDGLNFSVAHSSEGYEDMGINRAEEMIRGATWHEFEVPGGRDAGAREVSLWSRTWGKIFVVEIEWDDGRDEDGDDPVDEEYQEREKEKRLEGRVTCRWDEYGGGWALRPTSTQVKGELKSERLGDKDARAGGQGQGAHIPALEEVLMFLPEWAIPTTSLSGLVDVVGGFSI